MNNAPTATVTPSQLTVNLGTMVTLDGTGSSDPDNDPIVGYTLTQTSGTPVTLNLTNPAKPTFTTPGTPTTLSFTLVVSDGTLSSTNGAQTTITVVAVTPAALVQQIM